MQEATPPPYVAARTETGPLHWTLARYHKAIEAGVLTENDRVECIGGQLIERMPIGKRHADTVDRVNEYFVYEIGKTYLYRVQNPISLLDHSEPEPDYAIIDKASYAQREGHPTGADVKLVIEVSDATLDYDRTVKLKLYAAAGIPEYWIINLRDDLLEVHTQPDERSGTYLQRTAVRGESVVTSALCGEVRAEMFM